MNWEVPNLLSKDEAKKLLKGGGCPANNTKCKYLQNGKCRHPEPELSVYEGEAYCASMIDTLVCIGVDLASGPDKTYIPPLEIKHILIWGALLV